MAEATDPGPPTTFRLMDLPNEIITEICSYPELRRNDLRALRLTSKFLCEITSHHFGEYCFSEITVLMTRSSLQTCIELSRHPCFGSLVQRITISALLAPSDDTAFRSSLPLETVENLRERSRMERELTKNEDAEQMLSVAFKAFAQREQRFSLQFCDSEPNAIGARDLMRDEHFGETLVWHTDWKMTIERTIRAVTSHSCKVTRLCIEETYRRDCVNDSSLCTDDIEQELSFLCSNLTYLDVGFYHDDMGSTVKSLKRMVSAANKLESLILNRLGTWEYSNRHYLPEILRCVTSTSLDTIALFDFQMSESELLECLGRQKGSLQEITLGQGCLLTGSCMSLVAWIKDNVPGLVHFDLEEICDSTDHPNCPWDGRKSYFIGYRDDMQDCLASILDGK